MNQQDSWGPGQSLNLQIAGGGSTIINLGEVVINYRIVTKWDTTNEFLNQIVPGIPHVAAPFQVQQLVCNGAEMLARPNSQVSQYTFNRYLEKLVSKEVLRDRRGQGEALASLNNGLLVNSNVTSSLPDVAAVASRLFAGFEGIQTQNVVPSNQDGTYSAAGSEFQQNVAKHLVSRYNQFNHDSGVNGVTQSYLNDISQLTGSQTQFLTMAMIENATVRDRFTYNQPIFASANGGNTMINDFLDPFFPGQATVLGSTDQTSGIIQMNPQSIQNSSIAELTNCSLKPSVSNRKNEAYVPGECSTFLSVKLHELAPETKDLIVDCENLNFQIRILLVPAKQCISAALNPLSPQYTVEQQTYIKPQNLTYRLTDIFTTISYQHYEPQSYQIIKQQIYGAQSYISTISQTNIVNSLNFSYQIPFSGNSTLLGALFFLIPSQSAEGLSENLCRPPQYDTVLPMAFNDFRARMDDTYYCQANVQMTFSTGAVYPGVFPPVPQSQYLSYLTTKSAISDALDQELTVSEKEFFLNRGCYFINLNSGLSSQLTNSNMTASVQFQFDENVRKANTPSLDNWIDGGTVDSPLGAKQPYPTSIVGNFVVASYIITAQSLVQLRTIINTV